LALKDEEIRLAVVEALGHTFDSRALEPLMVALNDSDFYVRNSAAEALASMGLSRRGFPVIELLIADLKDHPLGLAQKALDIMKWQPGNDSVGATYWIATGQIHKSVAIGAPAVAPLISALQDKDWGKREAASDALMKISDPHVADIITAALKSMEKEDIPELVNNLVELFDSSPRGDGWSNPESSVTKIGNKLDKMGGMEAMREAHALFAQRRPRAARNLEYLWDGIGSWRG
jgi:HEAT repeat protein